MGAIDEILQTPVLFCIHVIILYYYNHLAQASLPLMHVLNQMYKYNHFNLGCINDNGNYFYYWNRQRLPFDTHVHHRIYLLRINRFLSTNLSLYKTFGRNK